jgi:hypothetical protein
MMPELTKVIAVVFGGLTVIVALWTATLAAIGFPLFWKLLAGLCCSVCECRKHDTWRHVARSAAARGPRRRYRTLLAILPFGVGSAPGPLSDPLYNPVRVPVTAPKDQELCRTSLVRERRGLVAADAVKVVLTTSAAESTIFVVLNILHLQVL